MDFPNYVHLSNCQKKYIKSLQQQNQIPFVLSKNFISELENLHKNDLPLEPLLTQIIPDEREEIVFSNEKTDPLGATRYSVTEHLVHQYKNRVLFLVSNKCFGYCRYCFRKNFICSNEQNISEDELEKICDYLSKHNEIQEILFSGGDPLVLSDERLFYLIKRVRVARHDILIRICTRALFYEPNRFTKNLILLLKNSRPLWIIPHINHFYEIDDRIAPNTVAAIRKIIDSGISMQSQTVLLRTINDDVKTLSFLFENLAKLGVKPGYLFQLDLARGTSYFRVPLEKALHIFALLQNELSGLSLPTFALDLPGGGGKFNLLKMPNAFENVVVSKDDNAWKFKKNTEIFEYPID